MMSSWDMVGLVACGCVLAQPASSPTVEGKPQIVTLEVLPAARAGGPIVTPMDLLVALRASHETLRSLEAEIKYDVLKGIAGDRKVRFGRWYYQDGRRSGADGEGFRGVRKTAVRFDTLLLGAVKHDDVQIYVFDGEWLVEKHPGERQMTKRRVAKPGQAVDPLSVEGPLPVPIGQPPEKVLERFDAQLVDATQELVPNDPQDEAAFKKFVEGCYQLQLTLKPEFQQDSEIRTVRLWYAKGKEPGTVQPVPRLIRVENRAEDVTFLQLIRAKEDAPIPPEVMDTTTPPDDWKVDIRE